METRLPAHPLRRATLAAAFGLLLTLLTPARAQQLAGTSHGPAGASGAVSAATRTPTLRVLVPAYFYPVSGSPWVRLSAAAQAHPGRIAAIGNPFNGPGTSFDAAYAAAFADFKAHGGTLLGYVYSSYGARAQASVMADMDTWTAWYPIDGFFIDEMDNTPGAHELYYQALYTHARSLLPLGPVVGNPGVSTVESYLTFNGAPVSNTLCIVETGSGFSSWASDAWVKIRPRRHFCALAYGLSAVDWQGAVDHAWDENCGWVFVTDDVLPNPWDTLPPWFETMASYVDAAY